MFELRPAITQRTTVAPLQPGPDNHHLKDHVYAGDDLNTANDHCSSDKKKLGQPSSKGPLTGGRRLDTLHPKDHSQHVADDVIAAHSRVTGESHSLQ